ncbi:MAG: HD domain-containing protein [Bacteroidales bacterium]
MNKKKIINDPVYGFINIYDEIIYDLIEAPYFQRLRRIKQLGLTHYVYPGATHTRFHHSLGAIHLMQLTIDIIRSKGHEITSEEARAAKIAILLHDLGHGPLSHTLENVLIDGYSHEQLSLLLMHELNKKFYGELSLAIEIFTGKYKKRFLHQLVSSQLDVDRLDYLRRDSFYTGVSEGIIGSDRIIKMLNVHNDQLVIEAKGIHSIEKFLIARWIMYWQVYFHKTVISAEQLITNIIKRAKELIYKGEELTCTPVMKYFLTEQYKIDNEKNLLLNFAQLDDSDIAVSIKNWANHDDYVLSNLCKKMYNRKLYKIELQNEPFDTKLVENFKEQIQNQDNIKDEDIHYFVFSSNLTNKAYSALDDKIQIIDKNDEVTDVAEASDMLNLSVLSKIVKKYFLCYPKENNI